MRQNPWALRWWPLLYVGGFATLGVLWAANATPASPRPGPSTYIPLLVGSVLLCVGTVRGGPRRLLNMGVALIMFGLLFRTWAVLFAPGILGARLIGPVLYTLIALGFALTLMFAPRISQ